MANAYTMSGGQSADVYSGSYNITPTTTNVTLDTKDKILEEDLTITGGGQLYNTSIKYGESIFGVSGTGVELTYESGVGMAYRSLQYTGDIITKVEDGVDLKPIGQMPEAKTKYTYYYSSGETLVSSFGSRYITKKFVNNMPVYYVYNGSTLVSTIALVSTSVVPSGVQTINVSEVSNPQNGDLIIQAFAQASEHEYGWGYVIHMAGTYKVQAYEYTSPADDGITLVAYKNNRPVLYDDYVVFLFTRWSMETLTRYGDFIVAYNYNAKSAYRGTFTLSTSDINDLQYYNAIWGADGYIYTYDNRIQGANISGSYDNFIKLNTSGTVISKRSVKQADLNFTGSSKLPNSFCSVLSYFVDATSKVYLLYSNVEYNTAVAGVPYTAIFTSNMASKTTDKALTPQPSTQIASQYKLSVWYDIDSSTIILCCYYSIIRTSLGGYIYAFCLNPTIAPDYWCPYLLDTGEIDYCCGNTSRSTTCYEDKSALKIKTITTSTYTATIEEV